MSIFLSPQKVMSLNIASQNQVYSDELSDWQVIQELGNSLSGTVSSFTFRVSTAASNSNQFDYTAQNTRIYDKDNGSSYITGCVPSGASSSDRLRGLSFSTSNVPSGYEDVIIDFSCNNYNFISGHRYIIRISNANMPQYGGKNIKFAASAYGPGRNGGTDKFTGGGLRYANGNPWDYSHNSGTCNVSSYIWGDTNPTPSSGCNVWTTSQDDLYFVLSNTTPEPTPTPTPSTRFPVIFIPGIGGSEFKASQDIIWSKDDGHGGIFSHAYTNNEKVWVNEAEAAMPGTDDYFDVLRLQSDGQTSEAPLSLTGDLTSFGYADIDSFFQENGYTKGTNFFVFPYDWRKDVRTTTSDLDNLVEEAKTKSGMPKANIVAHSMGGLVARNYISDSGRASKINKLIELGVPHLGSVDALRTLQYGSWLGYDYHLFHLGIPPSETKDNAQNMTGLYELLPSSMYFNFYNNSDINYPYPFSDSRDIDNNGTIGDLSYSQTKTLLENLHNSSLINIADQFHNSLDSMLNQNHGINIYLIVGTSQPTIGQIRESWWINWPIQTFPKYEEIYINGDGTVPTYSASLKSDILDYSGNSRLYYVEQNHSDLVSKTGPAMQTVAAILSEGDSIPIEVKDEKIVLEGEQISVDQDADLDIYDSDGNHTGMDSNGNVETNIPGTFFDTLGTSKHFFIKKSSRAVTVKVKSSRSTSTNIKKRTYRSDQITKTTTYQNVPVNNTSTVDLALDPSSDTSLPLNNGSETIPPTSEVSGSSATDLTPPATTYSISGTESSSNIYTGEVTITLTSSDSGSGVSATQYSLDNGQTVQTYTEPIHITAAGTTTIQFFSSDLLGNQEYPQTITITIVSPTPTPTTTPTSTPTPVASSSSNNTSNDSDITSQIPLTLTSLATISAIIAPKDASEIDQVLGLQTTAAKEFPSIAPFSPNNKNYQKASSFSLPWFLTLPPLLLIATSLGASILFHFLKEGRLKNNPEKK